MKPAIFNTDMVRAILDGRKTQTRRIMKPQPEKFAWGLSWDNQKKGKKFFGWASTDIDDFKSLVVNHAPYKKGDIIYVRETFNDEGWEDQQRLIYKADVIQDKDFNTYWWKPSIHMPKEYARLFLRVKDVRIERLNEISYEDALSEGIERDFDNGNEWHLYKDYSTVRFEFEYDFCPQRSFGSLWESIYGKDSFNDDYVWVIEFDKISKEEAING